jgi:acetyl esterase
MTVIDGPAFKAETDALLARFAAQPPGPELDPYEALLLDREELPDPALAGSVDPAVEVDDLKIGSLQARMYRPRTDGPRPVLLWLHGGGFIGGDLRDIEAATSGIAAAGNVIVVSLNYRLAPENPYPAALHDVRDALDWLREHQAELNSDGWLAVGGQSAGAALAAGACLLGRDEGRPHPDRQILCYPCLDLDQDTESYRLFDGTFLSIAPGRWSSAQYFPTGELPATAVPLRAETLKGLPPALILAAGRDPLRDDARNYAARLEQDDVTVRLVEYADTMHAFLNFPGVLSAARHAIDLIGADLRSAAAPR